MRHPCGEPQIQRQTCAQRPPRGPFPAQKPPDSGAVAQKPQSAASVPRRPRPAIGPGPFEEGASAEPSFDRGPTRTRAAPARQKPSIKKGEYDFSKAHIVASVDGILAAIMRDGGVLHYCRMHQMAVQVWSPLQVGMFQGMLLGPPEYEELNVELGRVAERHGIEPDVIAYAWLLRIPGKIQVITGSTRPERLAHATQAADIRLTHGERYDLYRAAGNQMP